jgi:mannose-6-phosphate isomerase-like protein (cupin superfamily)
MHDKKCFVGRVADYTKTKGWFFGHFMDEELLRSGLVEVAWQDISNKTPDARDRHWHQESVEINIVIAGRVAVTIDGEQHEVGKGEFYVVYPLAIVEAVAADADTELIVVRAPSRAGDKFS